MKYFNRLDGKTVEITYEKALDIMLATWKDNDMTRDMLAIPNNIQCCFGDIHTQSDDGMCLMAGLWNMLPMGVEYDEDGNHIK